MPKPGKGTNFIKFTLSKAQKTCISYSLPCIFRLLQHTCQKFASPVRTTKSYEFCIQIGLWIESSGIGKDVANDISLWSNCFFHKKLAKKEKCGLPLHSTKGNPHYLYDKTDLFQSFNVFQSFNLIQCLVSLLKFLIYFLPLSRLPFR